MTTRRTVLMMALASAAVLSGAAAFAQEQIYGSQMMTEHERLRYRDRIRDARTEEERARIRQEHHTEMQKRARERGMTLPDQPPAQRGGGGQGPADGMRRRGGGGGRN